MNKVLGIFGLLIFVFLFTSLLNPDFVSTYNIQNTLRWTSLFGILSIGVAFVVITGGIDLSLGSLIGLIGCLLPMSLELTGRLPPGRALNGTLLGSGVAIWAVAATWLHRRPFRASVREGLLVLLVPPYAVRYIARNFAELRRPLAVYAVGVAAVLVGWLLPCGWLPRSVELGLVVVWMLAIAAVVGLLHGVLITQVRLQPFVVTLCGLLFYRGLARWLTDDQTQGFGTGYESLKRLATGRPCAMGTLLFAAGVVLAVAGGWQWLSMRRRIQAEDGAGIAPWSVALLGAVLAVACGLQFVPAAGQLPRGAPTWTQQTLFAAGAAGLAAGVVCLNLAAIRQQVRGVFSAEAIAVVGLVILATVSGGEPLGWWRASATALGLAVAMTGVTCLLRAGWQGAGGLRTVAFLTAVSGVLLLAGCTPVDRVLVPAPFLILVALAVLAGFLLNYTLFGRYLLALGRNEEAARYSGINTRATVTAAYVLCSLLAGVAGILFALDFNAIQPAGHGNFFELYAIAAAVLGGCSLRGGEGSILGVVIGAAVMRVLYNAINMLGIPTQLEFAIIGAVILIGVMVDELVKRLAERRSRTIGRDAT